MEEIENLKAIFLKEIAVIQIQVARKHLMLGKTEQMMQEMKLVLEQKKVNPRSITMTSTPINSSDKE